MPPDRIKHNEDDSRTTSMIKSVLNIADELKTGQDKRGRQLTERQLQRRRRHGLTLSPPN